MTVRELIEKLREFDGDMQVVHMTGYDECYDEYEIEYVELEQHKKDRVFIY